MLLPGLHRRPRGRRPRRDARRHEAAWAAIRRRSTRSSRSTSSSTTRCRSTSSAASTPSSGTSALEFERNQERYQLPQVGPAGRSRTSGSVPPGTGIVHQVNLEYLATRRPADARTACARLPRPLVGTDSHTTMINGLGVVGWGVGGIEAEARHARPADLHAHAASRRLPPHRHSSPRARPRPTSVLTVTQMLRKHGVVEKFVEFFGPGLDDVARRPRHDRQHGARIRRDDAASSRSTSETLRYLERTGRPPAAARPRRDATASEQGSSGTDELAGRRRSRSTLELDLSIDRSRRSPARSGRRIASCSGRRPTGGRTIAAQLRQRRSPEAGREQAAASISESRSLATIPRSAGTNGGPVSSTATSSSPPSPAAPTPVEPVSVMIAAGLVAKKAVAKGRPPSRWVEDEPRPRQPCRDRLPRTGRGLDPHLDAVGFQTVGYGCTTCIGNSGPLPEPIANARSTRRPRARLRVLSGNRNFEGRVHAAREGELPRQSPPLVVAYALAGPPTSTSTTEPLGNDRQGRQAGSSSRTSGRPRRRSRTPSPRRCPP